MKQENSIITIQELLKDRGVDFDAKKVKLVRHDSLRTPRVQDKIIFDGTLYEMYRRDYQRFINYQNEQKIKNFINDNLIIPIGSDINVLTIGIFLPISADNNPYFSRKALLLEISSSFIKKYLPYFFINTSPPK